MNGDFLGAGNCRLGVLHHRGHKDHRDFLGNISRYSFSPSAPPVPSVVILAAGLGNSTADLFGSKRVAEVRLGSLRLA